jgi:hypothetical protein
LLKSEEIIPASVDGFITDVIDYGEVSEIAMDDNAYRPLKGGTQIKNDYYTDVTTRGGGTLGCFAILDDGCLRII